MCNLVNVRILLVIGLLAGCAHTRPSLVPLGGSPTTDLTSVALVREDHNHPAILRGLDQVLLESIRIPSALKDYAYAITPGRHVFWLMGSPYPHPLIPQRLRCYTMQVELEKGVKYLLKEDVGAKKALLTREDTGVMVSTGELVDLPWVFSRGCKWQ